MALDALTQGQLDAWVSDAKIRTQLGRLPDYIPLLAQTKLHTVAVEIQTTKGKTFAAGEVMQPFALMSVIKPFLLLFVLERFGIDEVFKQVGMQPSDQPFHSLTQLSGDRGHPRNPMINSGAIALAALLPGGDGASCCNALCEWLNRLADTHLVLDQAMLTSVRSMANESNRAIANMLSQSGHLTSVELALDTYNHICCLSGTVGDLARLGLLLAQPNLVITRQHQQVVTALMLTCGLYEASGAFAVRIGLPTKSGVSGSMLSIVPKQGVIASYSPAIDPTGNSVAGLFLLEKLATHLNLSIFG
ncbi:MAG: glutaminase A [Phormidesmis sp. CAN_BIN36]|nr:glutaminase A [Phormidesmis sp. CAN_BIN36]